MQWNSLSFELDACCYFQERFVLLWTWLDTWFFSFHKIIQIIVCWSLKPHFNLQMLKIEAMERFNTFNIWFNKLLWKMKVSSFYSSFWIYCVFTDYSHITVYNDNFKLSPKVYTNINHGIRLSNGRLNLTVTLWQCNHYCTYTLVSLLMFIGFPSDKFLQVRWNELTVSQWNWTRLIPVVFEFKMGANIMIFQAASGRGGSILPKSSKLLITLKMSTIAQKLLKGLPLKFNDESFRAIKICQTKFFSASVCNSLNPNPNFNSLNPNPNL